jgi:hypothetical protein
VKEAEHSIRCGRIGCIGRISQEIDWPESPVHTPSTQSGAAPRNHQVCGLLNERQIRLNR